jgi:hypothetical protein
VVGPTGATQTQEKAAKVATNINIIEFSGTDHPNRPFIFQPRFLKGAGLAGHGPQIDGGFLMVVCWAPRSDVVNGDKHLPHTWPAEKGYELHAPQWGVISTLR